MRTLALFSLFFFGFVVATHTVWGAHLPSFNSVGRTFAELDILFEQRVPARKFASTVIERLDEGVATEKDMAHGQDAVQVEHAGVHTKE